jgi:hypothetical protein
VADLQRKPRPLAASALSARPFHERRRDHQSLAQAEHRSNWLLRGAVPCV